MNRPSVSEAVVTVAKAVIISAALLALADYFAVPFLTEAGGA